MIKKVNIENFGLFKNYVWDSSIGSAENFRIVNIIYGRNYSGKTTLSRIFKSVEDGQLHCNYSDCKFSLVLTDGTVVTHNSLEAIGPDNKIRVYNTDFVAENLSWLHNIDGTIKPFTILGAKNVELDRQIKEIEEKIGNAEQNTGMFNKLSNATALFTDKKKQVDIRRNDLDGKLRTKAQNIKNTATFNYPTYQINTIKGDILNITDKTKLSDEETDKRKLLLKEDSKGSISHLEKINIEFADYFTKTSELVSQKITVSNPISELLNDALLQEWVRQGIEKHRNKRTNCGFCGNTLPANIWEKLDAHFSRESEALRSNLQKLINELGTFKVEIENRITVQKDQFYATLASEFDDTLKIWKSVVKLLVKSIDQLVIELEKRDKDIFKEQNLTEIEDVTPQLEELIKDFNLLIQKHNDKTGSLSSDQEKAKKELRLSEVSTFIDTIDYHNVLKEVSALEIELAGLESIKKATEQEIIKLIDERRILEAQAKDESKGAELVNQHLNHFFGHDELKLVAEGSAPNIKFKIVREGNDAKNLSEGESSLISFCYFIAKLEDEMKDELTVNKLIIYIDDPISSLDSNHIFFMFSLIESVIAKQKKYGQLFISTHNLDFLKYLKKITYPDKYQPIPTEKKIASLQHFIIERRGRGNTKMNLAPAYLKNYITEFNYLFNEIYKCSISDAETISHHYQYNFGNNMRKFLEAYLFYKFPSHVLTLDQRLNKFFDGDQISINLVNRVINEYSHLGDHFDRGLDPIDVDAIGKIATAVIGKIQTSDQPQYDALMESIAD
ncbi:AAA family ATPase [Chryseobacterium sp.]|uniref:AAA family ATPase n=1 Tax=Chryseobacterium sp. TaxID=1871047 RepID=UPI0012A9B860|nr:AAA family ATPase [Chryseobacterium sp.]QFG54481.1 AAA family ATPase [Chryseobacterium sp.]